MHIQSTLCGVYCRKAGKVPAGFSPQLTWSYVYCRIAADWAHITILRQCYNASLSTKFRYIWNRSNRPLSHSGHFESQEYGGLSGSKFRFAFLQFDIVITLFCFLILQFGLIVTAPKFVIMRFKYPILWLQIVMVHSNLVCYYYILSACYDG